MKDIWFLQVSPLGFCKKAVFRWVNLPVNSEFGEMFSEFYCFISFRWTFWYPSVRDVLMRVWFFRYMCGERVSSWWPSGCSSSRSSRDDEERTARVVYWRSIEECELTRLTVSSEFRGGGGTIILISSILLYFDDESSEVGVAFLLILSYLWLEKSDLKLADIYIVSVWSMWVCSVGGIFDRITVMFSTVDLNIDDAST